jgi:tight adherence protein B
MHILFLGAVIFILCLLVIELTAYGIRIIQHPDRAEVRKRLKRGLAEEFDFESPDIVKKIVFSDLPFINRVLSAVPGVDRLELLMRQANVNYTMSFFILLSLALGLTCYLFTIVLMKDPILALLVGLAATSLPLVHLRVKKKRRIAKFEKQLPEGLGLIARALRAGHAFTSGMKLASEEFGDPLGPEFDEALDEINFGVSVTEALKNLAHRVDCPDLTFFVVSVILQRETGGNLAEIIESLAQLIRERFKFRGKVRVLSAEGRLSAVVLIVIPFLLFLTIFFLNRSFLEPLISDPLGRVIMLIAIFLMAVGVLVIRRIIKVEV